MIDQQSTEELFPQQQVPAVGVRMQCGAVVTNIDEAYEAGKKAGESLPKSPQDAYDAVQGTSKKLVESISWYVWQNVIRQFKGELEDIRDLLKKLDNEGDFNAQVDERINHWAKNHLNEAMERADVVGLVTDSTQFESAVESEVDTQIDRIDFDDKVSDTLDDAYNSYKFRDAVRDVLRDSNIKVVFE